MDVVLSRRVGMAIQHEADDEERDSVVEEARLVDTWDDLPPDIQELIEDLEDRPYREGVPYAWLGDPRKTEAAWALDAAQASAVTAAALPGDSAAHAEFCRNPLHPGPCKSVFDRAKFRRKRPLTGHFTFGRSKWWETLTKDDEDGTPVRDLTLQFTQRDYHIANGTVYRVDGVAYLVEHDDTPEGIRNGHQALQMVYDFHAKNIAPNDEGYQRAYFLAERPSPTEADKHASGALPPGRHLAGSAGDGSTQVWGYTETYFRPGDIPPILAHEYGHNVGIGAPRVIDPVTGDLTRVDDSRQWMEAGRSDAARGGPQSRVTGAQIDPGNTVARRWFSELNAGVIPDAAYPVGVTPYGATAMREDFAESVMMYLAGPLATGFPMSGVDALTEEDVPIYFRDFFPHRAAELDRLFPAYAERQRQQIMRERPAS
jgi:hypothetical protein